MDKIFGALSSSSTASTSLPPTPSSLMYLSDDEVSNRNEHSREKKGWGPSPSQFDWRRRRLPDDSSDDEDEAPSSSVSRKLKLKDLRKLKLKYLRKLKDFIRENCLEIKTSIGMDYTVDIVEEEDENDMIALGQLYSYTDDVSDDDDDDSETESYEWEEELEPTLKRKGNNLDDDSSNLHKRVRFSYDVRDDKGSVYLSAIPDYMRNPSKYTRYTFDEESNRRAYMEFLNLLRCKDEAMAVDDETLVEFPRSVAFAPKRKPTP
ncbi:unnamed protein product [Microthlaspi erraticum]|uniref:U5 small nuclear ribonucleoprotein TSSC4 n=1 Tax=Microthlaspi erraticum TaxID=1685480 RepID=A0A6D2JZH5_9BRAS|nr:unnamed protein product [Microthlaspi erraticum]